MYVSSLEICLDSTPQSIGQFLPFNINQIGNNIKTSEYLFKCFLKKKVLLLRLNLDGRFKIKNNSYQSIHFCSSIFRLSLSKQILLV